MAEKKPAPVPADDLQDQHDALGEQIRALQLRQMAIGAQINQRNLDRRAGARLDEEDPAMADAMVRIATIRAKETQGTVSG